MRNVVFLVKNGIGFGHIRRALILAEAVQQHAQLRPVIVSQATSLALYRNTPVKVINFPLLHRVPSAITEDFYTDLLGRLIDRLDPAAIVEDTYPDARYRRLPALADRPRILIMRRLDGLSLDQIRERGDLAHYDRILIAQDEPDFTREGHSGDTAAAVRYSGRCAFVGNIAHRPDPADVTRMRQAYAPDRAPLVVVNGGAGGDQMPDGYGDRLFHACQRIAATLAREGHPARFALITGPYYAGRPLQDTANVTVRRYEPHLSALLAAADIAVIKPGNNALSEALAGHANLILVPDVSFMEGLDEHAARTVAIHGGSVATPDEATLEPLVRQALNAPARRSAVTPSTEAITHVVTEIHHQASAQRQPSVPDKKLLLALVPPATVDPAAIARRLPDGLQGAVVIGDRADASPLLPLTHLTEDPHTRSAAVLIDGDLAGHQPTDLVKRGCRLLIDTGPATATLRWLRMNPPPIAIPLAHADKITIASGSPLRATRRITSLLSNRASAVLLISLQRLPEIAGHDFLNRLAEWITTQPIALATVADMAANHATQILEGRTP